MPGPLTDNTSSPLPTRNLTVDEDSDSDVFISPFAEEREPLLSDHLLFGHRDGRNQSIDGGAGEQPKTTNLEFPQWPLRRSSSDQLLKTKSRDHDSSMNSAEGRQTSFRVDDDDNRPAYQENGMRNSTLVLSRNEPVQQPLRRTTSNSGLETRPRRHDPTIDATTLQKRLFTQTTHTGKSPIRPWRVRRVRTASGPFQWTNPRSPSRPGFMWFPVRSNSDPSSTVQIKKPANRSGRNTPLKPCMKQKSRSAATTPPAEQHKIPSEPDETRTLRRVKTVDFEEDLSRKQLSLPPLKMWIGEADQDKGDRSKRQTGKGGARLTNALQRIPSFPGLKTKSGLADTAITRTDVHVVAIAPSWNIDDVPDEGGIDPATPTMQIVESKNGCYEVVWDDMPPEYDMRVRRRSSSASHALYAATASSSPSRGLERVNTKLTEWSWGKERGSPTEPFRPQIVVFPEDDGRVPRFDCAVEDDDDLIIIAPPNSERVSANASRHASLPASARISRSISFDDPEEGYTQEKRGSQQESLVVPDPEAINVRPGSLFGTTRRVRKPPSIRRLSNMEDSDLKFRSHRDSVTLARSRIFNAGGVSPELFMHRDSISMAKKRMQARNHATSGAREIPQLKATASDPLSPIANLDSLSTSPPPKTKAAKALKNSSSISMLLPQPASNHRHIRIVE